MSKINNIKPKTTEIKIEKSAAEILLQEAAEPITQVKPKKITKTSKGELMAVTFTVSEVYYEDFKKLAKMRGFKIRTLLNKLLNNFIDEFEELDDKESLVLLQSSGAASQRYTQIPRATRERLNRTLERYDFKLTFIVSHVIIKYVRENSPHLGKLF